jgi:two-component system, OmpR family, sensor kinase
VKLRSLLRSKLALRIGLVGLAQMFIVALGFITLIRIYRPEPPQGFPPGPPGPDPAAWPGPPGSPDELRPPPEVRPRRRPPPIDRYLVPLVLIVVGTSTILLARSLVIPLSKVTEAAKSFGAGELNTRVKLERNDEIGEVANAFDDMAERVTRLLASERELLANVSHELRTPLARIRVALDLAIEGDAEMARSSAADIAEDLDELETLISDVLVASRLDLAARGLTQGIPPIKREPIEPLELVNHCAARFKRSLTERALELHVQAELPTILGDRGLLRRAIENLLENANKYSEPGTRISLSAREQEGWVVIEVADEGVGIGPEDLKHVFRPFFRVDRSRTKATGGHGLGLALVKRIVESRGGSIELTSEIGTQAQLKFPSTATNVTVSSAS